MVVVSAVCGHSGAAGLLPAVWRAAVAGRRAGACRLPGPCGRLCGRAVPAAWRGGCRGALSAPRGGGCCLLGPASLCRRRWPAAPQPSAWLPGGCWRRLGGCSERPVPPCQTGRMAMPDGPSRAARRPLFVGAAGPAVVCPRMCGPGAGRAWACLGFAAEVGWGARWAKKSLLPSSQSARGWSLVVAGPVAVAGSAVWPAACHSHSRTT